MGSGKAIFISQPIKPDPGTGDASAMARGEPGLPTGFTWRNQHFSVKQLLDTWKESEAEGHSPGGERYYRKRVYTILDDQGRTLTIYALRHVKTGESAKKRWWLYTIE